MVPSLAAPCSCQSSARVPCTPSSVHTNQNRHFSLLIFFTSRVFPYVEICNSFSSILYKILGLYYRLIDHFNNGLKPLGIAAPYFFNPTLPISTGVLLGCCCFSTTTIASAFWLGFIFYDYRLRFVRYYQSTFQKPRLLFHSFQQHF